ncbi:MAG: enoyl-CoA hydratase-related protein [Steroidobacteraceae bacterium]|nr:enoyl-CoA hydratase-related protein [Steroidobacteraceae bacterium]
MRVLLLTHAFNGLAQRLYAELARRGHVVSVEFDIADSVTCEAVGLFAPQLLVAPYLKRRIPEEVWRRVPCLVVHPGPPGDRGPSSLDRAILGREPEWGVTVLQADDEFDAGPVWASAAFPMREASKSSLYRHEVTEAATAAVLEAIGRFARGETPRRVEGRLRPLLRQAERTIDWAADDTGQVLRRIRAADSAPGLVDVLDGVAWRLYAAEDGSAARQALEGRAAWLRPASPGALLAHDGRAVLRATRDGAVWIGQLQRVVAAGDAGSPHGAPAVRGSAAQRLGLAAAAPAAPGSGGGCSAPRAGAPKPAPRGVPFVPDLPGAPRPCRLEQRGAVQALSFAFPNGALSVADCTELLQALRTAAACPARVLLLTGGEEFWCNGIDLNAIEGAASPADEAWRSIQAIDDVAEAIIGLQDRLVVSVLRAGAGAGGAFLALAGDEVWARAGTLLNLHYRNMGNLHGSEFWTYLLPRRIGAEATRRLMDERLPLLAADALERGVVDRVLAPAADGGMREAWALAAALASDADFAARLDAKCRRRATDEAAKPLAAYRDEELAQMRRSFYGFDTSFHVARSRFVAKTPHSWTPRHLARHRQPAAAAAAVDAAAPARPQPAS